MSDYRRGVVTVVATTTGLVTVTVDGTDIIAQALGQLPKVGDQVWIEQRGTKNQDWVITDVAAAPQPAYAEEWDYNTFSLPNNAETDITPQNQLDLRGHYTTAWSGVTWTAPVEGYYIFTAIGKIGAAAARSFVRWKTGGAVTLAGHDITDIASLNQTLTMVMWTPLAQTMKVTMFQNTGGAQVLDGTSRVIIARIPV